MMDLQAQARDLEILGSICQNDKLCTQKGCIDVYRPSSYRGLQRWWTGENRAVNLIQVSAVIERGIDTATRLLERHKAAASSPSLAGSALSFMDTHGARQSVQALLTRLGQAGRGLGNLVETYRDDYATAADIRLLVQRIRDFVDGASALQLSPIMLSSSDAASRPPSPFVLRPASRDDADGDSAAVPPGYTTWA